MSQRSLAVRNLIQDGATDVLPPLSGRRSRRPLLNGIEHVDVRAISVPLAKVNKSQQRSPATIGSGRPAPVTAQIRTLPS